MIAGDIFYTLVEDEVHIFKLLVVDETSATYHVMMYDTLDLIPTIEDIDTLDIFLRHTPYHKDAFKDPIWLANRPVADHELDGYQEYAKAMQITENNIPAATAYFRSGLELTDQQRHEEAIEAYTKAIELFPLFYEAIDNRAFCKMDLGRWTAAIDDFQRSLLVNPDSLLAEFSIGECYFKMGDYQQAKYQFEKAHQIDPTHELPIQFLKQINDAL